MSELSERDEQMLLLEHMQPRMSEGTRSRYARERFGLSATAYAQRLNWLLDQEAAVARFPVAVNRLRRKREIHRSL